MQFPKSSLVYPVGHGFGSVDELLIGIQLPFPSLLKPVPQISGIDDTTQFPSPSYLNPVGHYTVESPAEPADERGVSGKVIGMHPP